MIRKTIVLIGLGVLALAAAAVIAREILEAPDEGIPEAGAAAEPRAAA